MYFSLLSFNIPEILEECVWFTVIIFIREEFGFIYSFGSFLYFIYYKISLSI